MSASANVLVIDDEAVMRDSCRQILSPYDCNVKTAENGISGLKAIQEEPFDIVILDLKMPGMDGMKVLKKIKEDNPQAIVIVITGHATVESAVEAMKLGAYDFIPKPFTPDEFRAIVKRSLEKKESMTEIECLREELEARIGMELIIGQSKAMRKVYNLITKVGPTDSTVLITGESGTGKELVARAIHKHSLREHKPFVVADCGALVENLFESELFGHVKGAFTGATVTKHGRFELANGGTIFFDEIGNISLNVQSRLLRAIQEREVTKVGGTQATKIDVRIIAATNKDLQKLVQEEIFRDDLFYRLSVVPINLPPLRERKEDIPLLANHFLREYNKKRKKNISAISQRAVEILVNYDWPGNVREMENTIERAVVLTENDIIESNNLLYQGLTAKAVTKPDSKKYGDLAKVEKEHIIKALEKFNGNRTKASQYLGIDRKTLLRKMKGYGIVENR